ncbi:MAG TPA: D-aminoacyl-tRNA deacylase [Candidatus Cloacimonadota bacterium]|nr:D-aminoacyl-tRNA deacylase [Candidatus Cloacimonadota bacterium]HPT71828.1 D-aminoacyl-tRNA deacylase [Candidatus Cloacimonadota bacterium]
MKLVIQRVTKASVEVEGKIVGEIETGLLVLLGIGREDTGDEIPWLARKLVDMRIFSDENGKMNLSLHDVGGRILLVSQFTLYANCLRGRRPDYIESAPPDKANELYQRFAAELQAIGHTPEMGIFAADMKVCLVNDGPVTIILEK